MNPISRLMRSIRGLNQSQGVTHSFYSGIVRRNSEGAPRYDETRRDYEAVRRNGERSGLF